MNDGSDDDRNHDEKLDERKAPLPLRKTPHFKLLHFQYAFACVQLTLIDRIYPTDAAKVGVNGEKFQHP